MKRIYTLLIALSSMIVGFALSSFYSKSSAPLPSSQPTYTFSPKTNVLRIVKGTKSQDNSYYLNIINYGVDSITVTGIDSINTRCGFSIAASGSNFLFTADHGGIDSIPRTTYSVTSYTLTDSTVYSRYGMMYGKDKDGALHQINLSDIVTVQGGPGTITVGVVPIDIYE